MRMPLFNPPTTGTWFKDKEHWSRPISGSFGSIYTRALTDGLKVSAAEYGEIEIWDFAVVANVPYGSPSWLGVAADRTDDIDAQLQEGNPRVAAAIARSESIWEERPWRTELQHWDTHWKPALADGNRALQAVDPASLDDEMLAAHLELAARHLYRAMYCHHALNNSCHVPVGDFLSRGSRLVDGTPLQLINLLKGTATVSAGARRELALVGNAIAQNATATAILEGGENGARTLEILQNLDAELSDAVAQYVDAIGWRPLSGYDVTDPTANEVPEVILSSIQNMLQSTYLEETTPAVKDELRKLRQTVSPKARSEFDALLSEAHLVYRLRDERTFYGDGWATGLLRRALRAAGRRLADRGQLSNPEHIFDLTVEEVATLTVYRAGPTRHDVTARANNRQRITVDEAPDRLGPEMTFPILDWLPASAQRLHDAIQETNLHMFAAKADTADNAHRIQGLAASPGDYVGTARIVSAPEDLKRVLPGDVIVAPTTSPAYNIVLPIIGAIVTDRGGLLSHAAIVSREQHIPAVVSTGEATRRLKDGALVRVNGHEGWVEEVLVTLNLA
ncbi:PEP-utilizing enzyme [Martelella mangrovi]|uniref:Pyruvate,water dikinase n=1 Tax=Martelella mangrovi TaxID=1397477 RepID=A0ABV2IDP0_9HYPH